MCLLGASTFQPHFNPSQPAKKWFFGWVLTFPSFLEFVPRITPLQVEPRSWNLSCISSKSPRCAYWGFQLFEVKIQLCPNLGEGCWGGQKSKNCPLFKLSDRKAKLYNISQNQPLKLIRSEGVSVTFWPQKSAVPPLSSLQIELRS